MKWKLDVGNHRLEFGNKFSGLGLVTTPRVKPIVELESFANPRGDGRRHGRMYRRGQSVFLRVEALADHRSSDEVWREFLSVWRADEIRSTPGALATLTAETGRFAVGMPVDLEPDQEYRIFDTNRAEIVFEAKDDLWYGEESQTRIYFQIAAGGGLRFPARAPFRFTSVGETRNAAIQVDGDVATWPVFEIHGPVTNPEIEVQGVGRLIFSLTLAYDQVLRVDTRPWARWVKRGIKGRPETLAPEPGALSPGGSRLSDMSMRPGSYTALLRGFDATGTAEMRVSTWPAYTSF